MAFGILESRHYPAGDVPGTALLDELNATRYSEDELARLKKGTGRFSHVVLVPQPSDDPNDPLNWPRWRKEVSFWIYMLVAALVGAVGPLLAPGYLVLAEEWGISVNDVAATNGDLVLALGVIMIFIPPVAAKIGKRPVYLAGVATLFFCSIWSAVSKNLTSFMWSRIFQGFGMAAFEGLLVSTIADMYFVHERGLRTTIWGFAIGLGISTAPIINGYVIESNTLGYRWCFWLLCIPLGLSMFGILFFCPETAYDRDSAFTESAIINHAAASVEDEKDKAIADVEHLEKAGSPIPSARPPPPPKTFMQQVAPISYIGQVNVFKLILRPFPFFCSPIVIYGFTTYALATCWSVVLSVTSSIIFAQPPYEFNATQTGLTSLGGLAISFPSTAIIGPLTDWVGIWFARRNGGRFEPEFRLILVIGMAACQIGGFGGWCAMARRDDIHWMGPVSMLTLIGFGNGIGSACIVAYIIDVFGPQTAEAIGVINLSKNLLLFGFTQFASNWVLAMGVSNTMGLLAGITAVCLATTIPMWIYGKRARAWHARHKKFFLIEEEK
ncbi:hypothetical protein JCM10207_002993 [Rhodosporidiobolus poonsookiae]